MTDPRLLLDEIQARLDDYPDDYLSARLAFDDRRELLAALRAVLDEHHPDRADGGQTCSRCGDWSDGYDVGGMFVAIEMAYPCPTVRAITDALAGES